MDEVIDRHPETNCDKNRRAHSEEQLRRLRIASAFIAASSSRGSTILGLVGFEGGIQEIAHGLRSSFSPAHGGTISVHQALIEAGDADIVPVVIGEEGILAYAKPAAPPPPTNASPWPPATVDVASQDATPPPGWTQVHHILNWAFGGGTDLTNLCLLCGHHHREHEKRGWRVVMKHGKPWWIPPAHVDPERKPIRNTLRDPVPA